LDFKNQRKIQREVIDAVRSGVGWAVEERMQRSRLIKARLREVTWYVRELISKSLLKLRSQI